MSLVLEWDPELSARTQDHAKRLGVPSESLVKEAVEEKLAELERSETLSECAGSQNGSLLEILGPYIGCVDSSGTLGPEASLCEDETSRAKYLEDKHRQGRG